MSTFCTICERNFASSYNLKRHMETTHADVGGEDDEIENDSESDSGSSNEKSIPRENDESNETSEESEDSSEYSDSYTYDEVRAILRYALETNSSET